MKSYLHFSIYGFISVLLFTMSCTGVKQLKEIVQNFNSVQSALINEKGSLEPMRLFLITSKRDSILLRTKSTNVLLDTEDQELSKFVNRLYATVRSPENAGVGIAAPQVGILKNIIWVQRFDKKDKPFEVYYNPRILQYTDKTQYCLEGCLSIPERRDTTKDRAYAIMIDYDKIDDSHHTEMVEAFTAVIFQHEIDHLNGILYLDHLDMEIKEAEERLKKDK